VKIEEIKQEIKEKINKCREGIDEEKLKYIG
jgi:hypothetical protein